MNLRVRNEVEEGLPSSHGLLTQERPNLFLCREKPLVAGLALHG